MDQIHLSTRTIRRNQNVYPLGSRAVFLPARVPSFPAPALVGGQRLLSVLRPGGWQIIAVLCRWCNLPTKIHSWSNREAGAVIENYDTTSLQSTCIGTITNSLKKFTYNITLPVISDKITTVTTPGSTITSFVSLNISSVYEVTETTFIYKGEFAANTTTAFFKDDEFPSSVTLASTTSANSSVLTSSKTSITGPTPSVTSSPSGER